MPKDRINTNNTNDANKNLTILNKNGQHDVKEEILDKIINPASLMREANNVIIGEKYRLDAKKMSKTENGHNAGDYKLDIQTVARTKKQSTTVAVAFLDPNTPNTSQQDLINAFEECMQKQFIYRVR